MLENRFVYFTCGLLGFMINRFLLVFFHNLNQKGGETDD